LEISHPKGCFEEDTKLGVDKSAGIIFASFPQTPLYGRRNPKRPKMLSKAEKFRINWPNNNFGVARHFNLIKLIINHCKYIIL